MYNDKGFGLLLIKSMASLTDSTQTIGRMGPNISSCITRSSPFTMVILVVEFQDWNRDAIIEIFYNKLSLFIMKDEFWNGKNRRFGIKNTR